jgi:hypothetical protein
MFRKVLMIAAIVLPLGIGAAGCTSEKSGAKSENGQEITRTQNPRRVIVQVVGRDSTITVRAGIAGPTYSVSDSKGTTVVPESTLPQLQAAHPELARRIGAMNASTDSPAATVWAGVE